MDSSKINFINDVKRLYEKNPEFFENGQKLQSIASDTVNNYQSNKMLIKLIGTLIDEKFDLQIKKWPKYPEETEISNICKQIFNKFGYAENKTKDAIEVLLIVYGICEVDEIIKTDKNVDQSTEKSNESNTINESNEKNIIKNDATINIDDDDEIAGAPVVAPENISENSNTIIPNDEKIRNSMIKDGIIAPDKKTTVAGEKEQTLKIKRGSDVVNASSKATEIQSFNKFKLIFTLSAAALCVLFSYFGIYICSSYVGMAIYFCLYVGFIFGFMSLIVCFYDPVKNLKIHMLLYAVPSVSIMIFGFLVGKAIGAIIPGVMIIILITRYVGAYSKFWEKIKRKENYQFMVVLTYIIMVLAGAMKALPIVFYTATYESILKKLIYCIAGTFIFVKLSNDTLYNNVFGRERKFDFHLSKYDKVDLIIMGVCLIWSFFIN